VSERDVVVIVVVLAVVFEMPASEPLRETHTPTGVCDTKAFEECNIRIDKVTAVTVSRMSPMVMNEDKSGLFCDSLELVKPVGCWNGMNCRTQILILPRNVADVSSLETQESVIDDRWSGGRRDVRSNSQCSDVQYGEACRKTTLVLIDDTFSDDENN
jgi:hypothetical protein